MHSQKLPFRGQLVYASGMLGWSILINMIAGVLVYFYDPPVNADIPYTLPKVTVWGIFSFISLIAASGRIWDAITDPVIAFLSDRSRHPAGRRIPFMRVSVIPVMVTGILLYFPLKQDIASVNVWWLIGIQLLFYLFLTIYIIPYNALIAELGHTTDEKLRLSTLQSVAFFIGMITASTTPAIAEFLYRIFDYKNKMVAFQYSAIIMITLATCFLLLPAFFLNERKYSTGEPHRLHVMESMKPVFTNRNFFLFIVADFAYFIGITIIGTGALYYVTVLLGLNQSFGSVMGLVMLLLSLAFYPLVNMLARKLSKKMMILTMLYVMGAIFLLTYYLGEIPFAAPVQGILVAALFAFPLAVLGILPPVVLAEITHLDAFQSKQNKQAAFFAIRSLFDKFGQTIGIVIFTMLTHNYGKDPGHDLGIRLSGIFGFLLCFIAATIFAFYNEKRVNRGIREMEEKFTEGVSANPVATQ